MSSEEQFDFSYIMSAISKWFLLIIFFILLGLGGAFFYNYSSPIEYESKTTLYVEPQVNSSIVNYEGILTNQRMVKTYIKIIESRKIIEQVIENLKLNMSYEKLLSMVNVSSIGDTEMISIAVLNENYTNASLIANEIAKVFIEQLKEDMGITNIAIIDEAIINKNPVAPSVSKNLVIGFGLGLIIGLVVVFIIESMDNKIKNHDDVKKHLKIKTLGVIPNYSIDFENNKKKTINQNIKQGIKILDDPSSVISESMRMLRTNLNFLDLKVLNVISTVPSEGKTEVLTNLAVSFALLDKKVLVVDCDLRKPKVHRNFNLFRKNGLSDVILSKGLMTYRQAIQKFVDKENDIEVDVLAAGSKVSNPSELINSKGFTKLINEMKDDYDLILIDCPPVSSITDGVLVSHLSDGTVYVIESDRTDYQVISNCIDELNNNKAFLLGAVLTKVDIKHQKKLYGYKYDYYYSNYNK